MHIFCLCSMLVLLTNNISVTACSVVVYFYKSCSIFADPARHWPKYEGRAKICSSFLLSNCFDSEFCKHI